MSATSHRPELHSKIRLRVCRGTVAQGAQPGRRCGHIDRKAFLAVSLSDVCGDFSDHLASGLRAEPVDDLNQHIHRPVNQLRSPRQQTDIQKCNPDRTFTNVPDSDQFHSFEPVRPIIVRPLRLRPRGGGALEPNTPLFHKHSALAWFYEETFRCGRIQSDRAILPV